MFFLHFYNFSRLKYLLALTLVLSLVACAGGGTSGLSDPSDPGSSGSIALSWVAPSEREDNTGLQLSEIEGFRIYYGTEAGVYQNQLAVNDSTAEQVQIVDVTSGTYYIVMTTVDTEGQESVYSSELVVTL